VKDIVVTQRTLRMKKISCRLTENNRNHLSNGAKFLQLFPGKGTGDETHMLCSGMGHVPIYHLAMPQKELQLDSLAPILPHHGAQRSHSTGSCV